MSYQDSKFPKP